MADRVPGKPRNRMRILLVASLALNLLIVGLVAGAMLGGHRDHGRDPALRDLGFGPFIAALPPDDRAALRDALRREAGALRANRAEMRAIFDAFLSGLRADPFDAAALRRVVEDQQAKIGERQALGRELLWQRIEAMDSAERRAYADALQRKLRRKPPRGN